MKFLVASCLLALTNVQLCFRSANYCPRHLGKDILLPCLHQVTLIFLYSNTFFQSWTQACSLPKRVGILLLHPSVYCSHLSLLVVDGSAISLTYIASERIIPGCVGYALKSHIHVYFYYILLLTRFWNALYADMVVVWVLQKLL